MDESVFLRPSPHRSGGAICWGDSIEMCPDALYLRLTGMSVEDYMPKLRHSLAGA